MQSEEINATRLGRQRVDVAFTVPYLDLLELRDQREDDGVDFVRLIVACRARLSSVMVPGGLRVRLQGWGAFRHRCFIAGDPGADNRSTDSLGRSADPLEDPQAAAVTAGESRVAYTGVVRRHGGSKPSATLVFCLEAVVRSRRVGHGT